MSWPTISECNGDIAKDPSLLQLFPEKEWMSIQELLLLSALQFRIISERLFTCIACPTMWGRLEWNSSPAMTKMSVEAIPFAILVTDWGGRKPGHDDHLLLPWSIKMEASNALSAIHQCDLLEPSVVIVRRYGNTPYMPQGSSCLPYLDISTLSRALPLPNSHQTSYVYTDCSPSLTPKWSCLEKRERWGWKCFPISERLHDKFQKRSTTSLTQFCCWFLHWPLIPGKKRAPRWSKDQLTPSPQASTRCQSSQSSAGVWVGPRNTWVSSKVEQ